MCIALRTYWRLWQNLRGRGTLLGLPHLGSNPDREFDGPAMHTQLRVLLEIEARANPSPPVAPDIVISMSRSPADPIMLGRNLDDGLSVRSE
jgi:hypothetical protein